MDCSTRDHLKTRLETQLQEQQFPRNKSKCELLISEFIGTFVFVYLAQSALTSFELTGTQNDTINRQSATILCAGLAFLFANLLTIKSSGAHLNPAYTIASATFGHIKWRQASYYLLGQYSGSFLAAVFLHATYSDKLSQRHSEGLLTGMNATLRAHGNILSTGKFFASFPPTEVSLSQLSISYTLATAHFMLLLRAIHDSKLLAVPSSLKPIYLAGALILIEAAFSANGGPVLNSAQDFCPRLYIALFGWTSAAFNLYSYKYWWLTCLLMPQLGAFIGFGIYQIITKSRSFNDETSRVTVSAQEYHQARNLDYCS